MTSALKNLWCEKESVCIAKHVSRLLTLLWDVCISTVDRLATSQQRNAHTL